MKLLLLPGDGIGPEVMKKAEKIISTICELTGISFSTEKRLIGGAAIDATGEPLPDDTLKAALDSDAVLLASVGGPKWDSTAPKKPRPEDGLLGLRKNLNLNANLRPVKVFDDLIGASPIRDEIVKNTDLLIVRELTGGIYFGQKQRDEKGALDSCYYSIEEIGRTVKLAFEIARERRRKLTLVDKANVLETSRLWREVFLEEKINFPDIDTEILLVDNAAMQLIKRPSTFDVIVTENMFGDILSDEAAMVSGSIGLLASVSMGNSHPYLYEPVHGSAPDIAGKNLANPLAMILSLSLMFRYSFKMQEIAEAIEKSVEMVIREGYRTIDISFNKESRKMLVGTNEMGDLVEEKLRNNLS